MATEVANLAVRVGADISPLAKDMKRARRHVSGFSKHIDRANRKVTALGRSVVLTSAGIGAITAAFFAAGKKASGFAVEINNLVQDRQCGRRGISTACHRG